MNESTLTEAQCSFRLTGSAPGDATFCTRCVTTLLIKLQSVLSTLQPKVELSED